MKFEIEIDDYVLQDKIASMLSANIIKDYEAIYGVRDAVKEAAQKYIYAQKDEIIEKVIDRATKEIVKKGLPKLLERYAEGTE